MIAIGHSGINGEGNASFRDVSWATGSLPAVHSVYQRLVEVRPQTRGHVANVGVSGSHAAELVGQARTAFLEVAAPALVLVYSMENDFHCANDETPYVSAYGEALRTAFAEISTTSPESEILIVSSFGRPASYAALFDDRPDLRRQLGGNDRCDMWNARGELLPARVQALTATVQLYEAEMARVCATFAHCHTDDGRFATYEDSLEDLVPDDWGHLNPRGHAKLAELIWPRVVEVLGLE